MSDPMRKCVSVHLEMMHVRMMQLYLQSRCVTYFDASSTLDINYSNAAPY